MNSEPQRFDPSPTRSLPVRTIAVIAVLAFLAGLAAMALGIQYFREQRAVQRSAPVALKAQPKAEPASEAPEPPPGTNLASLYVRERELASRIQLLEERLANVDSDSRIASSFATRAEGLMVAFAARRALDRGLALGYIEGQLRERFGAVQPRAVAYVIEAARRPVTIEDLRLALDTLAPELTTGGAGESWWAIVRRELGNLVTLRDEQTPSPRPADRLTRARRMLDAGQVEGALAEVARLPGAERAASWIDAAKRYVNARRALNAIETTAIQGRGAQPELIATSFAPAVDRAD